MNRRRAIVICSAGLLAGGFSAGASPALAQTFQTYRCADSSEFIVGFFKDDSRAHLQIDGRAVALARRLTLSGSRYSGGGVSLRISKTGTTLKHARRPATACEPV